MASAAGGALQAMLAHQPSHPLAPDAEGEPEAQLGVDARRTVGLAAACVDLADLLAEERVLNGSGRWRPGCPGVVAGACHTQHAAQPGDRVVWFLRVDQPVAAHR